MLRFPVKLVILLFSICCGLYASPVVVESFPDQVFINGTVIDFSFPLKPTFSTPNNELIEMSITSSIPTWINETTMKNLSLITYDQVGASMYCRSLEFVMGDSILVACADAGIAIIDRLTFTLERLFRTTNLPTSIRYYHVNRTLIVAGFGPTLNILDISDPLNPIFISETEELLPASPAAPKVAFIGGWAFVCGNDDVDFQVFDLQDYENPHRVGSVERTRVCGDIRVDQNAEYVAVTSTDSFDIYDVRDKTDPYIIGSSDTALPRCLAFDFSSKFFLFFYGIANFVIDPGNILFGGGAERFYVVNVTSKTSPSEVGSVGVDTGTTMVACESYSAGGFDRVMACDGSEFNKVYSFNMNDRENPVKMGDMDLFCDDIIVDDMTNLGFVLVAGQSRVKKWDVSAWNPVYVEDLWFGGDAMDVIVDGDRAYLAAGELGLVVYDVSDPSNREVIDIVDCGGLVTGVMIERGYLYISVHSGSICSVDMSNLEVVHIEPFTDPIYAISEVSDCDGFRCVCVTLVGRGFAVLDITDPNSILVMQHLELGVDDEVHECAYVGNYVYLALGTGGFSILDATNSSSIVPKGNDTSVTGTHIFVDAEGKYAYLSGDTDGLTILDVTDKNNPVVLSTIKRSLGRGVTVLGNTAFVAEFNYGITVYDVTDRSRPFMIDYMIDTQFERNAKRVFVTNDNLVFVAAQYGFQIYGYRREIQFRGYDTTVPGEEDVEITADDGNGTVVDSFTVAVRPEDGCESGAVCFGRGTCVGDVDDFVCACDTGFYGDYCDVWSCDGILSNSSARCNGHGECHSDFTCTCDGNYDPESYCMQCLDGFDIALECVDPDDDEDDDDNDDEQGVGMFVWLGPTIGVGSVVGGFSFFLLCLICCCCMIVCLIICIFLFGGGLCGVSGGGVITAKKMINKKIEKEIELDINGKRRKTANRLLERETEIEEAEYDIADLRIDKNLFQVSLDEIELLSVLGKGGSSSTVYKASYQGAIVAFKCFKTSQLCSSQLYFDGAILEPPRVGILMEFCENGDLHVFLLKHKKKNGFCYPVNEKVRLLLEIAQGMAFLHRKNIIHRDLKPENILVDGEEHSKIMDFGVSKVVDRMSEMKTTRLGTPFYMAPEIVLGDGSYDNKVDVFSYGIMIHTIMSENFLPYGTVPCTELKVANDPNFRPKVDEMKGPKWLVDVSRSCWSDQPASRWTFQEIVMEFNKKMKEEEEKVEEKEEGEEEGEEEGTRI